MKTLISHSLILLLLVLLPINSYADNKPLSDEEIIEICKNTDKNLGLT